MITILTLNLILNIITEDLEWEIREEARFEEWLTYNDYSDFYQY